MVTTAEYGWEQRKLIRRAVQVGTGSQGFATSGSPLDISYPFDYNGAMMDTKHLERQAKRILDVMSDGKLTGLDLMYVAMYTVINAYPLDPVLDRLIEYVEHVKIERDRMEMNRGSIQDTLF